jgi:hypothetical protein
MITAPVTVTVGIFSGEFVALVAVGFGGIE